MSNYLKDNYFAKVDLSVDSITGLTHQVRAVGLNADATSKTITVTWQLVLLSSTGAVMQTLESGAYTRVDDAGTGMKYDDLQASPVGLGIKQMIEVMDFSKIANDLSNFPQCLVQGYIVW